MKRITGLVAIVLVLAILSTYIFIPANLKIAAVNIIPTNSEAAFRIISKAENWQKWSDGALQKNGGDYVGAFVNDDHTFYIKEILHNAAKIKVTHSGFESGTLFTILPITKDSSVMKWESELATGSNPFTRVQRYRQAVSLKKNIGNILDKLQAFLKDQQNVYGYNFKVSTTTDTLLVAYKTSSTTYPNTKQLYDGIFKLQQYIVKEGARQIAPPMLNITKRDENLYEYMLALPVDKVINAQPPFLYRKLVAGNFLITTVKGGEQKVNEAMAMMQQYMNDYGKTSMAIPFRRLITDRLTQPDSTKWETEIYYPVIR